MPSPPLPHHSPTLACPDPAAGPDPCLPRPFPRLAPAGEELGRGTKIVLTLKEDCLEFLEEERLKGLIKRYSEFINFPIYLYTTKEEEEEVPTHPAEIRRDRPRLDEIGRDHAEITPRLADHARARPRLAESDRD